MRQQSHSSRARFEIFRDEDDFTKRQPVKIVGIDQISTIITSPEKKEIVISVGNEQLTLTCSSRADVDDWIRDIDCLRKNGHFINKRSSGDEGMGGPAGLVQCELIRCSCMYICAISFKNISIFIIISN